VSILAPRVLCLQHNERVRALSVATWAAERGVDLTILRVDEAPLPAADAFTCVVVLGGSMNTDDVAANPWLDDERAFLRAVIQRPEARVFGICLGAQLLAEALGGSVSRATEREIGWHRIELTPAGQSSRVFGAAPPAFDAMEWHGDAWTLPPTATLIASSLTCATQAFEWEGRVFAVQFHPEFTYSRTRELVATTTDDLSTGAHVQSPEAILADPARFEAPRMLLYAWLDRALLTERSA